MLILSKYTISYNTTDPTESNPFRESEALVLIALWISIKNFLGALSPRFELTLRQAIPVTRRGSRNGARETGGSRARLIRRRIGTVAR